MPRPRTDFCPRLMVPDTGLNCHHRQRTDSLGQKHSPTQRKLDGKFNKNRDFKLKLEILQIRVKI